MRRVVAVGAVLTLAVAGAMAAVFGTGAFLPVALFGLLATAIQAAASRAMDGALSLPNAAVLKRYGLGMGLRLLGVAALLVMVSVARERFPPLPTALGFLGVLIPLLFLETRPTR